MRASSSIIKKTGHCAPKRLSTTLTTSASASACVICRSCVRSALRPIADYWRWNASATTACSPKIPSGASTTRSQQAANAPQVHSLLHALILFRQLADGFRCADLRRNFAALSGRDPQSLSQGAITYQLRRLRLHGFIERLPNSFRYRVTEFGFRASLFLTRAYNRLFRPGLAAVIPALRSGTNSLKAAFDKINQEIDKCIRQAAFVQVKT